MYAKTIGVPAVWSVGLVGLREEWVHATIAGLSSTRVASMRIDASKFKEGAKSALDRFSDVGKHDNDVPTINERQHAHA